MVWNEEEKLYLRENYSKNIPLSEISNKIGRTIKAIKHKAARMNLHRLRFPSNKISKREPRKVIEKRYYEKNKKKIYERKLERRRMLKKELVEILGDKCKFCAYKKTYAAMEFHHERGDKEWNISLLLKNESRQKLLKEAKKCILLCANCHRELHMGV